MPTRREKDESTEAVQDDEASASHVAKRPACGVLADAASEFIVGWDKQLQKVFRMPKTELKSRKRRLDKEWTENGVFSKGGQQGVRPDVRILCGRDDRVTDTECGREG